MATVNPYLTFNGTCEAAFNFYKSIFQTEFTYVGKFKDMPLQEGMEPLSEAAGEKIMHIGLPISQETILMASDSSDEFGNATIIGNNISLSINAESEEEAKRLFDGLSADGNITMPLEKTFWGALFGMFEDKFGIHWMVNYDYNT